MFAPCRVAVLLACAAVFAQEATGVSGTVRSKRTSSPLSGATVQLRVLGQSATTDAEGGFALQGATGVRRAPTGPADPGSVSFRQLADGPATIRVLDPQGVQRALLHSGPLATGTWNFRLPPLPAGIYTCSFETPSRRETIRFLATSDTRGAPSGISLAAAGTTAGARSQAGTAIDTLVVTKSGFKASRLPLDSYRQSGLDIQLDDSSATDTDLSTIVPDASWPCLMPDGIPPPTSGTPVFKISLKIGAIHDVGLTRFGQRRQYDLVGGTMTGDKINATAVTGGLDYDLTLSNGSKEIEQIVIFKAGSTPILMRNPGVAPIGAKNARMVLDFEAPNSSSYTWLHTGKYVATRIVDTVAKTIQMDVYDVGKAAATTAKVQIKDPAGDENQSWACVSQTGGQGATVLTENVTLGSSISIGATKGGSRNIIPITGGTTSGKVVGKILDGGADYQMGGLDARYTLAPNDGEFIIVRNCGPGTLYPVFEARVAGPYNFLNQNKYVSSSPNVGAGGVSITFYEKK